MIILNKDAHETLGNLLKGRFDTYEGERRQLEIQWLKNLRQYKAIYDPEVKIPEGKSRVYPKDTHTKLTGWVAKMMEMLFPAQELNFAVEPTPFPNIAMSDLESIIATLEQQQMLIAQQQYQAALQEDPNALPPEPEPPTSEQIEKAVKDFAKQRAYRMELECKDQLSDKGIDYPELCKKTIRRGGIYGFGVVEGPNVKTQVEREWVLNPETGRYEAQTEKIRKPRYVTLKAWDVYPDLSAMTWEDQEGIFTRKVFPRSQLRKFADQEDFFGDVIKDYLRDTPDGNYKAKSYEAELDQIKHTDQNKPKMSRQYEVLRWYGFVSARVLSELGVNIPEKALDKEILADVWMLDGLIIKADTAPFGETVADMYHVFIPEDDEDSALTGTAKVETLRDSQLKLCAIDRALMDNMAESASSIKELNVELLAAGQDRTAIHGGMTILREGDGNEANYPAVRVYDIPNHTQHLLALRNSVVEVFDRESNLPAWRMGDAKPLGEAFRTSSNFSQMAGAGDMVTKDDARAFDRFVKSMIGSLVAWNMEFNKKEDIKGDFQVQPKGVLSLVAKELRGAALDQLVSTLTPRQLVLIDERGLLEDRFKARDLPLDRLKDKDEAEQALQQFDQQQSQAQQMQMEGEQAKTQSLQARAAKDAAQAKEIETTVETKVQEALSRIAQNLAKAKGTKDDAALQSLQLLLNARKDQGPKAGTGKKPEGQAATE